MRFPRKNQSVAALLVFLLVASLACGGDDSCDDEVLADTDLGADDVVLVEDPPSDSEPVEQDSTEEETANSPSPVATPDEPSSTPEPTTEPTVTPTPEPTSEPTPTPTPLSESDIVTVLIDTYTWGQSQKTRALQQVLGLTADGYYGSGTRTAHVAELEARGLSTAGVPDIPPTPTPAPTPTPTPVPGPSYSPASITQTTKSCSDVEFDWTNPDSDPDSWQIKLDVRANVGSGNPPSSLWVSKTHTISGSSRSETFTSLEFHGQNAWVTLWGNGAPYSVVISRVDSGVVSTPSSASSGLMWDDC